MSQAILSAAAALADNMAAVQGRRKKSQRVML
jgi:hypothetical protein